MLRYLVYDIYVLIFRNPSLAFNGICPWGAEDSWEGFRTGIKVEMGIQTRHG